MRCLKIEHSIYTILPYICSIATTYVVRTRRCTFHWLAACAEFILETLTSKNIKLNFHLSLYLKYFWEHFTLAVLVVLDRIERTHVISKVISTTHTHTQSHNENSFWFFFFVRFTCFGSRSISIYIKPVHFQFINYGDARAW